VGSREENLTPRKGINFKNKKVLSFLIRIKLYKTIIFLKNVKKRLTNGKQTIIIVLENN